MVKKKSLEINELFMNKNNNTLETLWNIVGDKNKYQYYWIFIMCLINSICANYYFSIPFFFEPPVYKICLNKDCSIKEISSWEKACNSKFGYETINKFDNFIKNLDLECNPKKSDFLNSSIFFLSSFISVILINISDIIGRRKLILYGLVGLIICFLMNLNFYNNYTIVLIFNFLTWGILDSFLAVILIIISESTGEILREKACNYTAIIGAVSGILVNLIIFYNLKLFIVIEIIIVIIIFILVYRYVAETIYFYYKKKLFDKLNKSLKFISEFNNKLYIKYKNENKLEKENYNIKQKLRLWLNKNNIFSLLSLIIININNFFCYQIILYSTTKLNSNTRINGILSCISELLSFLVMSMVTHRYERVKIFKISIFIIFIFSFSFIFIENLTYNIIMSFIFIKFFVCVNMSVCFIYQNEIFETNIRGLGTSISIFMGRFLGSLSPLISFLRPLSDNPITVCIITNIITFPILFFMKETYKKGILN